MSGTEGQLLRIRDRQTADDLADVRAPDPPGAPALVAQTLAVTTYPTTAGSFYGVQACTVSGAETEGGAGTVLAQTGTFFALNLGTAVPPTGTEVVITFVPYRFVFRYDG